MVVGSGGVLRRSKQSSSSEVSSRYSGRAVPATIPVDITLIDQAKDFSL